MKPFDVKRWEVLKGSFDYFDFSQVPTDFPNPHILGMYSSFQCTFESMIFLFWLGNVSSQDPQDLCILGFFVSHWNSPTSTEFSSLDGLHENPISAFRLDKQWSTPLWMVDTVLHPVEVLVFGNQIITYRHWLFYLAGFPYIFLFYQNYLEDHL